MYAALLDAPPDPFQGSGDISTQPPSMGDEGIQGHFASLTPV